MTRFKTSNEKFPAVNYASVFSRIEHLVLIKIDLTSIDFEIDGDGGGDDDFPFISISNEKSGDVLIELIDFKGYDVFCRSIQKCTLRVCLYKSPF